MLLFQLGFLRGDLFARLFQLRDGLLACLVQIAEIGLQALPALALFPAENQLNTGVLALTKRSVELCCKVTFLSGSLEFQFGNRRIHLIDLLVQHGKGVLRFAQFARGGGDRFLLLL
ncbi:hypothetical protein D3C72_1429980 [compost metagenome]